MSVQAELVEDMPRDAAEEAAPARRARDVPRSLHLLTHRQLIGYLGLSLPLGVYVLAGFVPTDGLTSWRPLMSVSEYYYTGAGDFFVGVLFAMALFLFTYPGYQGVLKDRLLALVAGVAALGVAVFPTNAPGGAVPASWWRPALGTIHLACAAVLFSSFALFALWLFRLSEVPRWRDRDPEKKLRDVFFLACGCVILACMGWVAIAAQRGSSILLPEMIAIMAFALAWLVKGEAQTPAVRRLARAVRF